MISVGGIVLCGGRSTRMGRPKAWLPFAGERLLTRSVRIVSEVAQPVVVVAAADQALPPVASNVEIVRDAAPDRGPLQGIAAGLESLKDRAEAAFVSSCDVPFLQAAFIRRMIELMGDASICAVESGGYKHPLAAVFRISVLPVVQTLLGEQRLRPAFLFDEVPTRMVAPEELRDVDQGLQSLRNVNTPEEYAAALREIGPGQ
jgi:molybdenum cofactor guanylyltransferase